MISAFTETGLRAVGFSGFEAVSALRSSGSSSVPISPGVYIVLRDDSDGPAWLAASVGGHFKGKDPSVSAAVLKANWIAGTPVIYIGKADQLRRRLQQYMDFGAGRPVGHWGGRLIWQIRGSDAFRVAWAEDAHPLAREARMIRGFMAEFGAMPFANLRL